MKIVKNRKMFFAFSIIVIVAGILAMPINALLGNGIMNFDVEFSGGTLMHVNIGQDFTNNDISQIIQEATGQSTPQIQRVIGTNEVMIKMQSITEEVHVKVVDALIAKYGLVNNDDYFLSYSDVSATISGEMQQVAIIAVVVSCIAMFIYIILRFKDARIASSAIIVNLHDIMFLLAVYTIFRIPVNNSFIAALLTILGYSINATIVIFDRLRENKKLVGRKLNNEELIDSSVRQTLTRSIYTSLTTLFVIACVYIFGVQSMRDFALPIIIGVVAGTYSSVCVSGSLWYEFMKIKPKRKRKSTKVQV